MPDQQLSLPFLTREMLNFGSQAEIGLEVASYSISGSTMTIIGFTRQGLIKYEHTPASDSSRTSETFALPDIPIMIAVNDSSGIEDRGDTYIVLYLTINGERVQKLTSGWVSAASSLSWPNSNTEYETMRDNEPIIVLGDDPAAGAEVDHNLNANEYLVVERVRVTLVTDANAANRRVHMQFENGNGLGEVEAISSVDHPASTTRTYCFAPYGSILDAEDDDDILVNIPPNMTIHGTGGIKTVTTNLQAGDNFGRPEIVGRRFFNE